MELALSTSPLIASGAKFSEGGVGGGGGGGLAHTFLSAVRWKRGKLGKIRWSKQKDRVSFDHKYRLQ